ncbi:hypothetical protein BEH94_03640 [Candidatus Altiarchaeales archaeon WOR_SM1_SCG]|nr:hypothetical protein BEH94_03640 [Candidatus Altiarchaeales archaeon WOR_SM1_SCG]
MKYDDKLYHNELGEYLRNLPEQFVILIVSTQEKYEDTNIEILKLLCNEQKLSGLYITIDHSYEITAKKLSKKGIDTDNLFFIDLITSTQEKIPRRTKNCLFIPSPKSLTDLGIAIDEAIHSAKNKQKFLFVESVSALLLYNTVGTVKKLEHFLAVRMRMGGLKGILISLHERTEMEIIPFLAEFCDKVVKIE